MTWVVLMALVPHALALFWWWAERLNLTLLSRRIYAAAWTREQAVRELRNSIWLPLHALLSFLAMPWFKGEGLAAFFYSLLLTYAWAEVWHYYSHRWMHLRALHWIHKEHHKSRVCSPFTALSFSLSEKLIFNVGILSVPLALNRLLFPVSFHGVAAWYVGYLVINSFAHANFELRTRTSEVGTSTTYHALHHARYLGNYGLGTRALDHLHGTEWSDYPKVFARARSGSPLAKLNEKLG